MGREMEESRRGHDDLSLRQSLLFHPVCYSAVCDSRVPPAVALNAAQPLFQLSQSREVPSTLAPQDQAPL